MIPEFVEPFRRTFQSVVVFYRLGVARGEIVDKRPAPDAQFRGSQTPVKVERGTQMAVHSLHQPVDHVAGSEASRKIVGFRIAREILFQFPYRLGYDVRNVIAIGPFAESAHTLGKGCLRRGLVAVP